MPDFERAVWFASFVEGETLFGCLLTRHLWKTPFRLDGVYNIAKRLEFINQILLAQTAAGGHLSVTGRLQQRQTQ
jgi:hypothetical protein